VSELLTRIAALTPGQAVAFKMQRRSDQVEATVTPAQRPKPRALQQR
jgi:S1-C subfamily serine protease